MVLVKSGFNSQMQCIFSCSMPVWEKANLHLQRQICTSWSDCTQFLALKPQPWKETVLNIIMLNMLSKMEVVHQQMCYVRVDSRDTTLVRLSIVDKLLARTRGGRNLTKQKLQNGM